MNPFQRPETAGLVGALGGMGAFVLGMVTQALGAAFLVRREARSTRRRLGQTQRDLAGLVPGRDVLLEGVLEIVGEPGTRFEDGAPAAAATAAGAFCAASTRAPRLRLVMRDGTVDLRGKTLVVVGSREERHGAMVGLLDAMAARIRVACGETDPLPTGPLRLRSVAHGDRVVVAGRIDRAEEAAGAAGYREGGAPWTLEPEPTPGRLVITFAGLPAVSGVLGAAFSRWRLRKMAPFVVQAAAFGAAIGIGKASYDAHVLATHAEAEALAEAEARKKDAARLGDPAACKALAGRYTSVMDRIAGCTHDNDCRVELRGEQWYDLDGCFRLENTSASTEEADRIAREWLEARCVTSYEVCSVQPTAMCRQGRCVERPPPGVPETWVRHVFGRQFTFFAPPDVAIRSQNGLQCGPGAVFHLDRHDFEAHFILDSYGMSLDGDESDLASRPATPVRIGGWSAVARWMNPTYVASTTQGFTQGFLVVFPEKEATCPPFCLPGWGGGVEVGFLHFQARCRTDAACKEAFRILETLAPL